ARWAPNIILMPFGILALIWRARWAEGRLPFRSVVRLTSAVSARIDRCRESADAPGARAATGAAAARAAARRGGVVIVIRVPRMTWLMPNILDRYISA